MKYPFVYIFSVIFLALLWSIMCIEYTVIDLIIVAGIIVLLEMCTEIIKLLKESK